MKKIIKIEKMTKVNESAKFLAELWPNENPAPKTYDVYVCEADFDGQKKIFEVDAKFVSERGISPEDYFARVISEYDADLKSDLEADSI